MKLKKLFIKPTNVKQKLCLVEFLREEKFYAGGEYWEVICVFV